MVDRWDVQYHLELMHGLDETMKAKKGVKGREQ